jgi:4-alpha-glucanotransferase
MSQDVKSSGVLLHPSAFNTPYGIGDLGPQAYSFIDLLVQSKQRYWQVLPLTQANAVGCPYSSYSAFGGHDLLISPDELVNEGLISKEDLDDLPYQEKVSYPLVAKTKGLLLEKAFHNFNKTNSLNNDFNLFISKNDFWIEDYALFMALTSAHGPFWYRWKKDYQRYPVQSVPTKIEKLKDFILFKQFIFHRQWYRLKTYANEKGIKIIGDIPIFVAHHSMDVWKHPEQFKLNSDGTLPLEAGAPPDSFNDKGQKWNNPNYNWDVMYEDQFNWWQRRIGYMLDLCDIIRIDHFVGFHNVWEIPHHDSDARKGKWVLSRGKELLMTLQDLFPNMPFIAEDLGEITQPVIDLRDQFKLPGMKILQFGFWGDNNTHAPENINENSIAYTGTHDNNTFVGFLDEVKQNKGDELKNIESFFNKSIDDIQTEDFIKALAKTKANTVIYPLQDLFGLGEEARFNIPGTEHGNWNWIIPSNLKLEDGFNLLKEVTISTGRA